MRKESLWEGAGMRMLRLHPLELLLRPPSQQRLLQPEATGKAVSRASTLTDGEQSVATLLLPGFKLKYKICIPSLWDMAQ